MDGYKIFLNESDSMFLLGKVILEEIKCIRKEAKAEMRKIEEDFRQRFVACYMKRDAGSSCNSTYVSVGTQTNENDNSSTYSDVPSVNKYDRIIAEFESPPLRKLGNEIKSELRNSISEQVPSSNSTAHHELQSMSSTELNSEESDVNKSVLFSSENSYSSCSDVDQSLNFSLTSSTPPEERKTCEPLFKTPCIATSSNKRNCTKACRDVPSKKSRYSPSFVCNDKKPNSFKNSDLRCSSEDTRSNLNNNFNEHDVASFSSNKQHHRPHCKKDISRKDELVQPTKTHLTMKSSWHCLQCPKTFVLEKNLSRHMSIEHETIQAATRPYRCSYCNKAFFFQGHLTNHMVEHVTEMQLTKSESYV